jgi:tocopherol O-methyltransferase
MPRTNEKERIVRHYDMVSPYYQALWGEHIHHGYWIRGDESKETAQNQLIEHLARLADLSPASRVLDIGCGFGGTSLYLAQHYRVAATGITISPVQVEMANGAAKQRNLNAQFLLMDAEALQFSEPFDQLWSLESISHYHDVPRFFAAATKLLKPGGTFALTDWFRKSNLSRAEQQKFIQPIEKGMMVELHEMEEYAECLQSSGLQVVYREVLNPHCARSWDIGLDIIKDRSFWKLAAKQGAEFLTYLRTFRAMRAGYATGNFVCGLLVAKLPPAN